MIVPLVTFVLVANPWAFRVTRQVFGDWVAGPEGLATIPGLLLHAIVFMLLVRLFTMRRSKFKTRGSQQSEEIVHWQQRNEIQ
jgi:hypothetical protein